MISPVTHNRTIRTHHPVREDFVGCSTHDARSYYSTKGHAVRAFDIALQTFNLCLDRDDIDDFHDDAGRKVIAVCDEFGAVGLAVLSWYRMTSGRYEFIGYLA